MKGVIFDFNGTLFLDNDKHVLAWNRISGQVRGRDITAEALHEKLNGRPNKLIIRYLNGGTENPELEDRYSLLKEEYYRQFCKADAASFHLIQGAQALFDELTAAGVPFTIASASIKPNIDFFVENFHLDRWINPADFVYDDGTYENKTAMFQDAAENIQVPLQDITVIEDSLAGIESSLQAGIRDIRLLDSGHIREQVADIPQITQVVQDMTEIRR